MHLGKSNMFDTKHYGQVARENAELQSAYGKKCAQLNALQIDFQRTSEDLNLVQQKLKKLKYENEKLYQDCQKLRESEMKRGELKGLEVQKEKSKQLLSETDLIETYLMNLIDFIKTKIGPSKELSSINSLMHESLKTMRQLCSVNRGSVDSNDQFRQNRFEKLRDSFLKLQQRYGRSESQEENSGAGGRVRELEKSLETEKQDYNKKISLYKDQVKKMKQNIELFKESINQLQLNNQELQARQLLQQQQESKTGQAEMGRLNQLFTDLKDDNQRLA